jgi:hypothetical protein
MVGAADQGRLSGEEIQPSAGRLFGRRRSHILRFGMQVSLPVVLVLGPAGHVRKDLSRIATEVEVISSDGARGGGLRSRRPTTSALVEVVVVPINRRRCVPLPDLPSEPVDVSVSVLETIVNSMTVLPRSRDAFPIFYPEVSQVQQRSYPGKSKDPAWQPSTIHP